jgi:hypothetical protein
MNEYELERRILFSVGIKENQLKNQNLMLSHPELFFSQNKLKNLIILKLIAEGIFGKVNLVIFNSIYLFFLNFFSFKKVFTIARKSTLNKVFAIKVVPKYYEKYDATSKAFLERDIGKFGKKCKFLVETKATFASNV